jgi:hypothetical protein
MSKIDAAPRLRRGMRWVRRWRAPMVIVPLFAMLTIAGAVGAQMLTAEVPPASTESDVACWDDRQVESVDECSAPTGAAGLRWVFPSFHPNGETCRDVLDEEPDRLGMWECDKVVDEHQATVTYIHLAGVASARRFFDRRFDGQQREEVHTAEGELSRYVWRQPSGARSELVTMYVDHPYAVHIRANGSDPLTLALRTIEFRHPDRIYGVDAPR